MSEQRTAVLFEHTWAQEYLEGTEDAFKVVRTFRVVGTRGDDGVLDYLSYEEHYPDAMGNVGWHRTDNDAVPERAMAELLKRAGLLGDDEDVTCL